MPLVAGVDSSTQSCKVLIVDADTGEVLRQGKAGHPAGTEVNPSHWWSALQEAIAAAGGLDDVSALSVGGQQHGMVILDSYGRVIRPALLWNDTRSAAQAEALIANFGTEWLIDNTGSVPVASFTSTKLAWVTANEPENAARIAAVMLPHDYLSWRLAGYGPSGDSSAPLGPDFSAAFTDRSDASGTGYFNPQTNAYLPQVLEAILPKAVASSLVLPRVLGPLETGGVVYGTEIALGPGMGDNAGAAEGLGLTTGDLVVSLGTSGTVFASTPGPSHDASGAIAGFADATGNYLPLICTLNAARVLDKFAQLLGVGHDELGELALGAEPGAGGLVFVPYLEGERTPNLPDATATLHGMTLANGTRNNLARAAIEGMLCGLAVGQQLLLESGHSVTRLILIGGAAANHAVQQIAAQVFGVPVTVPPSNEYVALGAAHQAASLLRGSPVTWNLAGSKTVTAPAAPLVLEQYRRYANC